MPNYLQKNNYQENLQKRHDINSPFFQKNLKLMQINKELDTEFQNILEAKMDEKVEAFEYQLAFQEETIDQLNNRIWQQQQQIDLLEKAVKRLAHDFKQGDSAQPEIIDTPPPHY